MEKSYLLKALDMAGARRGFTAPNPAVGAVVVKNNEIIATGCHWAAGLPHAEREALDKAAAKAEGADLYISLEPCCHWGKTAPCTDAIIARKIARVFYACSDPNPRVAGRSAAILKNAGISVTYLPLVEAQQFYRSYLHWTKTHKPFVTAKLALSQDGKIAGHNGQPVKITGAALDKITHQRRFHSDAILTTVKTVNLDDPKLNVRLGGQPTAKPIYILDRKLQIKEDLQIYHTAKQICLLHGPNVDEFRLETLRRKGLRCVPIDSQGDQLNLQAVLYTIGEHGIHDLWVEVGRKCLQSMLEQKLLNQMLLYVTDKVLGGDAYPGLSVDVFIKEAKFHQWQQIDEAQLCNIEY